jgi:hypothetical protein
MVDHILIKHNIKLFLIVTVLPGSLRSTFDMLPHQFFYPHKFWSVEWEFFWPLDDSLRCLEK